MSQLKARELQMKELIEEEIISEKAEEFYQKQEYQKLEHEYITKMHELKGVDNRYGYIKAELFAYAICLVGVGFFGYLMYRYFSLLTLFALILSFILCIVLIAKMGYALYRLWLHSNSESAKEFALARNIDTLELERERILKEGQRLKRKMKEIENGGGLL